MKCKQVTQLNTIGVTNLFIFYCLIYWRACVASLQTICDRNVMFITEVIINVYLKKKSIIIVEFVQFFLKFDTTF